MKKSFLLMCVCLFASVALGQTAGAITPRVAFTEDSSVYYLQLYNSSAATIQEVINQPCPVGTIMFTPAVQQSNTNPDYTPPLSVFSTDMSKYSYPVSATFTAFNVKICYHVNGYVSRPLVLVPVLYDTNGAAYEPGQGGVIIWSGSHTISWNSYAQSLVLVWDISGFPITSLQLENGQFEFGMRVKYLSPGPLPETIDSAAVKIHSIDYKGVFTTSSTILSLGTPTTVYASKPSFSSGTIQVTTQWPSPSTAQGGLIQVRCADNVFRQVATFPVNSSANSNYTTTLSISYINTNACGSAPLVRGGSTAVRTQPRAVNGNPIGNQGTSSSFTLF